MSFEFIYMVSIFIVSVSGMKRCFVGDDDTGDESSGEPYSKYYMKQFKLCNYLSIT